MIPKKDLELAKHVSSDSLWWVDPSIGTYLFAVVDKVAEPLHRLILCRAVCERNESDSGDGHCCVCLLFKCLDT